MIEEPVKREPHIEINLTEQDLKDTLDTMLKRTDYLLEDGLISDEEYENTLHIIEAIRRAL